MRGCTKSKGISKESVVAQVPPSTTCSTPVPPAEADPVPPINWSHFQPEFAGKPDKDVEAYLLRTNDRKDTYSFPEGVKAQRFFLALVGKARLWYEPLRPIEVD